MGLSDQIKQCFPHSTPHQHRTLERILSCHAELNPKGYPIVEQSAFHLMRDQLVLLFSNGLELLEGIGRLLAVDGLEDHARIAGKVLQTVIRTANVTAPSDLWVLRLMLATHKNLGIIGFIEQRGAVTSDALASEFGLDESYLNYDLDFLVSRGYLVRDGKRFAWSSAPQVKHALNHLPGLPQFKTCNVVPELAEWISSGRTPSPPVREYFEEALPESCDRRGWAPTLREIEVGARTVAVVLAMRLLGASRSASAGKRLDASLPAPVANWLVGGGLIHSTMHVTALGERVFQRGPGPFGIIHAYYSYFDHHARLLKGDRQGLWVARGENVAASQDANRKTFEAANDNLDRYCSEHGFHYQVFIEHAVGQGEATRQRFARSGDQNLAYFGADLEQAAIDQAKKAQARGELPKTMRFVAKADIGDPASLVSAVTSAGFLTEGAVMMVGNGFHEVRHQSNERMIEVFAAYRRAGIILIFTEESGLQDEDLLETAWNTYHAGFRYVHAISGQGLRPAIDREDGPGARFSWVKCATLAGYSVLDDYCFRTRRIFPHPRADGYNPAISVTYFCVPKDLKK